jgi:3-isopropylmalate dehydrogenase
VKCLQLLSDRFDLELSFEEHAFGGAAIDACGHPLPEATLAACRSADAILLGAVGGPRWDKAEVRPKRACWRSAANWGCSPIFGLPMSLPGLKPCRR